MRRGRIQSQNKGWFKYKDWPKPNTEAYPDHLCECGGVAKHNGFPGEYWCEACDSGFWQS